MARPVKCIYGVKMIRPFLLFFLGLGLLGAVIVSAQDPSTQRITGTIDSDTPFQMIPLGLSQSGQTITVDMRPTSGNLDTMLYLVDAQGAIVAENDDRSPDDESSLIVYDQAPPGEYQVVATRYNVTSGDSSGDFELTIEFSPTNIISIEYDLSEAALREAGFPILSRRPQAEWTIFAYYGGDTDLEAGVLNDLKEFELAGGSTEQVRIIALVDRHPQFTRVSGNWMSARLFEVGPDISGNNEDELVIDSQPIADLGPRDSGNGELLAQFLAWGLQTYPANRYAVAFASHGAGWQGIISDDSDLPSLISLPELRAAFAQAQAVSGVDRFELLINDACLMSSIEYHRAMSNYFDLSIAAPEIVVDPALDMTALTVSLNADPDVDMRSLNSPLIDLVNRYMNIEVAARPGRDKIYLSQAITDLENFDPVVDATERFAALINLDPFAYSTLIGQARANVHTYAIFLGVDTMVDLGHFMQQIIALSGDPELVTAASRVLESLNAARIYGEGGELVQSRDLSYYNIYFPQDSSGFDLEYLRAADLPQWSQMLRNYYNSTTPRLWRLDDSLLTYHPPVAPRVKVTRVFPDVSSTAFPPAVSVEITGRGIASGRFTVDRVLETGRQRLLETSILTEVVNGNSIDFVNSWKSGVDRSVFNWLPLALPAVTDGLVLNNEFLARNGNIATLEGRYREAGSDTWYDASIVFDLSGEVQSIVSKRRSGSFANITLEAGTIFQAYRSMVTPDGIVRMEPGNEYIWPEGGLRWQEEPTGTGEYELGFLVKTFGGTSGFDSTTVSVNNNELDPAWRGYTDLNLGLVFERPSEWSAVGDFGDTLFSISENNDAALNIFYFRALDNVFDIVRQVQDRFALQRTTSAEIGMLDGLQGLTFDHTYQTEDGQIWQGRALALYRETGLGGRGIIISVDVVPGSATAPNLDELYAALTERIDFFDAAALRASDSGDWTYQFINRSIPYPVRNQWVRRIVEDEIGVWAVYQPRAELGGRTFAAVARLNGDGVASLLDRMLLRYAPDVEFERRNYQGEFHAWESAALTLPSNQSVNGMARLLAAPVLPPSQEIAVRFYVTRINNQYYAMRFETPYNDEALELYRQVFEPMVDGFAPPSNVLYSNGAQSALAKAALVAARNACFAIERDQICYGGGEVINTHYDQIDPAIINVAIRGLGDRQTLARLSAFEVGRRDDGSFDPYSLAIMDLPANLPESSRQTVRLYAFGGTTIQNESLLQIGEVERITMRNVSGTVKFLRDMPSRTGKIQAYLQPDALIEVVGRVPDSSWLRVRIPGSASETAWVYALDLEPIDGLTSQLRISDPQLPHFTNMQAIEVLLDPLGEDQALLNGVLIETSPGDDVVIISINGAIFEIAGGTTFFWQGTFSSSELVISEFGAQTKRRPGGWSSEVLSGSVRVRVGGGSLTTIAGTRLSFGDGSETLSLENLRGGMGSASLATTLGSTNLSALTDEELAELFRNQALLQNLNLSDANDLAAFFNVLEEFTSNDEFFASDANLLQFLANQTNINIEEILELYDDDGSLRRLLQQNNVLPPSTAVPVPPEAPEEEEPQVQAEGSSVSTVPIIDSDGDGVLDSFDNCPFERGTSRDGCPVSSNSQRGADRDKDGIPDSQDECPDDPGPEPYGCPGEEQGGG